MPSATGTLKINLDAIASNWRLMCELAHQSEVGAVIKANAYGLGSKKIAEILFNQGCRNFFVATLAEAIEIKSFLNASPTIYVFGGVMAGDEDVFANENFVPVIYSIEMLKRWATYSMTRKKYPPCAIKIDTGMSRFGMQVTEFLSEFSGLNEHLNLILLMSHLACADEPAHRMNEEQLDKYNQVLTLVKSKFPDVKASLANSSGIFLGKKWHFDLVRPGAALYGINPQPELPNPLRSVIHLRLPVLQVKTMVSDAFVGYSACAQIKRNGRLAIVAGGYADGVNRSLGARPMGICCGQKVYALGRISMDATIFEVSSVMSTDEEIIESGIDVISEEITVDEISQRNGALGYEVLTSLGMRYQREYVRDE